MATALQQQLAAIAAKSTHQLDLKAQKARHSKSLLFEPRDAATQSFDTIFQICYEGFEELCMLDSRFAVFGQNLFSEQSKSEDRTQMTAGENQELDRIVESFLGLVCGRLLLKPAMKAVEWLVRRFRVQEYNTEAVLLTFLPYHTSHIFPTLLSILPDPLPPSFKFLHPYMASLQSPPRHAILSAAISNQGFFSAFSQYVLGVAKARHHSAVLLGFWASITAQTVNGMIDTSRSGRDSIRKQREEDLLLRVLPILQSALSIKGIPELYLGSCMVMTILATKASLEDKVLDAMLEAVAGAWTEETLVDGLTCLAVISEQKEQVRIPGSVLRALLKSEDAIGHLLLLSKSQRAGKLIAGFAIGVVSHAVRKMDAVNLTHVSRIVEADILPDQHTMLVLEKLMTTVVQLKTTNDATDVCKGLTDLLNNFTESSEGRRLLEKAAQNAEVDPQSLQLAPAVSHWLNAIEPVQNAALDASSDQDIQMPDAQSSFEALLQSLPPLPKEPTSFLEPDHDTEFKAYTTAFEAALPLSRDMDKFWELPQLHRSDPVNHPEPLTFLVRVSTTNANPNAQVTALTLARALLEENNSGSGLDTQALLPYVISALADTSPKVRKASANLCRSMNVLFGGGKGARMCPVSNIYGASKPRTHWLSSEDAHKLLTIALLPVLEDCVVEGGFIVRAITDMLNNGSLGAASQDNLKNRKELKKALRADACTLLAVHATSTIVVSVKLVLLRILDKVGKHASNARSKVLLPYVKEWAAQPSEKGTSASNAGNTPPSDINKAVIGCLTHRSHEELQTLKDIAACKFNAREDLSILACDRLKRLFPVATNSQIEITDFLVDLFLSSSNTDAPSGVQDNALETLRALSLPTEVLEHMLERLPSASDFQDGPPSPKRQRKGKTEPLQPRQVDQSQVQGDIRRITSVLELVEGSKPARHPRLLKGLFHTLNELHHYKLLMGSELVYIHQIVLGCILAIVDSLKTTSSADIDRSVIRTDLIVECVRTTSSTPIHNTALLIVSSLATWAPELVLHSVMPLFTHMSSTLLRQSDALSAHVTDQTVARIIPPLAASLKKKGKDLISGVSELLLSFTAAYEHIPLHRRAELFEHLVQTLGADEALFAVIAMLIDRYPEDSKVATFVVNLVNRFPAATAIRAADQYLDLVFDALKPKRGLSEILLSLDDTIDILLEGLAALLQDTMLRERLKMELSQADESAERIHSLYATLLERSMQMTRDFTNDSTFQSSADSVLMAVLGLMPTKDFIQSSAQLMQTGSDQTRQLVFRSLEARVVQARRADAASQKVFIKVLPNCGVFVREDQHIATRHAAISCIDQISEKYGKTDRTAVLGVAQQVAGNAALVSSDMSLRVISILCLASMTEVLGDEGISILPGVLTQVLAYLEANLNAGEYDGALQNAGFSLFNAVLDQLPWMLSDDILDRVLKLADQASATNYEVQEGDAVQEFCNLVSKKVEASQLFAGIERTWTHVHSLGEEVMFCHLAILHQAIQHSSKSTITANSQLLFRILLNAFDLRRQFQLSSSGTTEESDDHSDLYDTVDKIALEMTLKLNDATFRPFFSRLVDWATTSLPKKDLDGRTLRTVSLYSFSLALFEQLKSIVTSYASLFVDNASTLLHSLPGKSPLNPELLDLVLRALSSSFNHDQDDFWQNPTHFEPIAKPLIDQLKNAKYVHLMEQVISTITDLAAAASSPEHYKTMNTAIMYYMRNEDAAVRLAAVKCERSITERVNIDWLALLPEMLPFISELQEDDDEDVERETLRWVHQIEGVTGESLEGMLA